MISKSTMRLNYIKLRATGQSVKDLLNMISRSRLNVTNIIETLTENETKNLTLNYKKGKRRKKIFF